MAKQALGSRLHTAVVPAAARQHHRLQGRRPGRQHRALRHRREPAGGAPVRQDRAARGHQDPRDGRRRRRRRRPRAAARHDRARGHRQAHRQPGLQLRRQGHHAADLAQDQGPRHQRHRRRGHVQAQLPDLDDGGVPGRFRRRRRPSRRRARAAAGQAAAGHPRDDELRAVARRPGHPDRLRAQHARRPRPRREADHQQRPAVVRPERHLGQGQGDRRALGHRHGDRRQDRAPPGGGVLPDVRPQPPGHAPRATSTTGPSTRSTSRAPPAR